MNKLNNILACVDFSDCSRSALGQAVRMAKWNNACLHVLHSVEYLTISDSAWDSHVSHETLEFRAVEQAKRTLHRWLDEGGAKSDSQVLVEAGLPIDSVLRAVRDTKADLLVMGVNGSSMIPMGAGTLAAKCLRKAPVKVLLVHERQTAAFRRIVACVDFSDRSRDAVEQVVRVAGQESSQIDFLHVFTGSWGRYYSLMPELWELDEHRAAHHRHMLEQRLREFVDGAGGPTTHFAVVQAANHGHGIVEYVRRVGADLIVLGAKGRSNLGYVLLGSTVERLLREIPCSALVVRPPPGGESMKETKTDNTTGGNDRVVKG